MPNSLSATAAIAVLLALQLFDVGRAEQKSTTGSSRKDFIALTVATDETDGLRRLLRSAGQNDISVEVLGLGVEWKGGDTRLYAGGGQKVRLLKDRLQELKDKKDLIVMFTDAYDVVINGDADEILSRFGEQFPSARVVFSAEPFCWPEQKLAPKYPLVKRGKRYLNSGLFIGYAPELYEIVSSSVIADDDDDQLFYTKIYLDDKLRESLKIELDSESFIFQNLHGASLDVERVFRKPDKAEAHNIAYDTYPLIVHGNGLSKLELNSFGNYLGNHFNKEQGCVACKEDQLDILGKNDDELPPITLALFVSQPTAFLEEFFEYVSQLNYPKARIELFVWVSDAAVYHQQLVKDWVDKQQTGAEYKSVKFHAAKAEIREKEARALAVDYADLKESGYLMALDASAHLTNPDTVKLLMQMNRRIVSPMLGQPNKLWTNFWGALNENGFYSRSNDYSDIATRVLVGQFNVPFVSQAVLIRAEERSGRSSFFEQLTNSYSYEEALDADMSFCKWARDNGVFLWVDNQHQYGHCIISDEFDTTKYAPDLYMIFDNRVEWERRYLDPIYYKQLEESYQLDEPCPDVFDFKWFTERFCRDLIGEMEHFGRWSSGNNQDERLEGGYENVPTRDIHMKQIDYERHWLYILDEYVRPIQEKIYIGYYQAPVYSSMMFVVRYRLDEQSFLRPHHDASTYSIDVALNAMGKDFQGGGVRFTRYNCSVLDHPVGNSLIFPGRLTHQHEGLKVTGGTRYIIVSFINP